MHPAFRLRRLLIRAAASLLASGWPLRPWAAETHVTAPASGLDRRYLALDPSLHAELRGTRLVLEQARDQRVILRKFDQEWEERHNLSGFEYVCAVFRDHEGRYRLYYNVTTPALYTQRMLKHEAMAVAFSDDGLVWTKPKLNLARSIVDDPASNLINIAPHPGMDKGRFYRSGAVFFDERAPAASRYKLSWRVGDDVYVAESSDGLNFTTLGKAFKHKADTQHVAFYDPLHEEYVMYGRKRADWPDEPVDRRGLPRHSSKHWHDLPWSNVGEVVIDPKQVWDYTQPITPQVYTPAIQYYHGQYIGLPAIFFTDRARAPVNRPERRTGTFYPMVMHSWDGRQWHFPDLRHPIIDLTPHLRVSTYRHATSREREVGLICAGGWLEKDGRLLVYYTAREGTHYEEEPLDEKTVNVAFLRMDGFARIQTTGPEAGEWITPELVVPRGARGLAVNARIGGRLRAEVRDAATGRPLPGFDLASSRSVAGDELAFPMQWGAASLSTLAGRTVSLRFVFEDGGIYSFAFTAPPEAGGNRRP